MNRFSQLQPRRQIVLFFLLLLLTALIISACSAAVRAGQEAASSPAALELSLSPFASGFTQPVGAVSAGDSRMFVIERRGVIKVVQSDGTVLPTPFLNIQARVDSSSSEEGLLGLAFHPDYATNGYFYVNYTNTSSSVRRSRISRFQVTADPNVADPDSENILLTVVQPEWNHNAGHIMFGPDGYLYVPFGDGGSGGDPWNNAQTVTTILGKINRIDINSGPGNAPDCVGEGTGDYTVPSTNPLVDGQGGACDEIWALGLRNPWRTSFDSLTGDLFIADVGQNTWEEVDFQPAGSAGGENYGWRCYEGDHPYNTTGCGPQGNYTFPIFEYSHSGGNCSVSGGYVYRGSQYPAMYGHYLLADFCSGRVWDLVSDGIGGWDSTLHTNLMASQRYVAFGEDINGELYMVGYNGTVYRIQEDSVVATATPTATPTIVFTPTVYHYMPVIKNDSQ
jgi:glucose/arabinose dehydrogenase